MATDLTAMLASITSIFTAFVGLFTQILGLYTTEPVLMIIFTIGILGMIISMVRSVSHGRA